MPGICLLNVPYHLFLPAFLLGLASSLHCVGMCGPIAFALPGLQGGALHKFRSIGLYSLGRVISYAAIGMAAGLVGRAFYELSWHQWFSVAAGLGIITIVLLRMRYTPYIKAPVFVVKVQQFTGKWFHSKNVFAPFFIGLGNGLLPCGMVYLAVVSAAGLSESGYEGAFFMTAFGFGTIPLMAVLSVFGFLFRTSLRQSYKRVVPYISLLAGLLLILRGMGLGIPFLSPEIKGLAGEAVHCGK